MNAFTPSSRTMRRTRAFTLLEMVITLAVMILLFAAVFEIMTGVFQSSGTLKDNQNHRDEIAALGAFLKNKLSGMSVQSVFISYRRGDGEGLVQNGIILGEDDMATAIDAKIQPNGYYTLRLVTVNADTLLKNVSVTQTASQQANLVAAAMTQLVSQDDPLLQWRPLISDVQQPKWRFLTYNISQWDTYWPGPGKPSLVELSLQLAGDMHPDTIDTWIPTLTPVSLSVPQTNAPPANAP